MSMKSVLIVLSIFHFSLNASKVSAVTGLTSAPVSGPLIATGAVYLVFSEVVAAGGGLAGATVGGVVGAVSGAVVGAPVQQAQKASSNGLYLGGVGLGFFGAIYAGIWSIYHGIVLLDANNPVKDFTFSPLTEEEGTKLGMTKDQVDLYNKIYPILNMVKDQIAAKLNQSDNPSLEESIALWDEMRAFIENLGMDFEVVAKICQKYLGQIQKP